MPCTCCLYAYECICERRINDDDNDDDDDDTAQEKSEAGY